MMFACATSAMHVILFIMKYHSVLLEAMVKTFPIQESTKIRLYANYLSFLEEHLPMNCKKNSLVGVLLTKTNVYFLFSLKYVLMFDFYKKAELQPII